MKLSAQAKRLMIVIVIVTVAAAIGSLVYYRSQKAIPFLLGLALGSATSIVRVLLLERLVDRFVTRKNPKASVQLGHLGRLLLAFAALLIGAVVEGVSLPGVIVGVLSYQLGTYTLYSTLTTDQRRQLDKNAPDTAEKTKD